MKWIRKNLKWVTIVVVIFLLIGAVCLKSSLNKQSKAIKSLEEPILEEKDISEELVESIPTKIYVDVKGAVVNPGVYEIEEGKKVIDAIGLAGGLTDQADTSLINLAKKVTNEMVVIIYTLEEVKKATEVDAIAKVIDNKCVCPEIKNDACLTKEENQNINSDEASTTTNDKINLNTATLEELQTLPGIGESKAQAIIDYRVEHGDFEKIEDLQEVSGIGEALYEKVKDYITV